MGIPFEILLALSKASSLKTAKHPSERDFCVILGAADTALLTQGKENKAKITKKDR